MKAWFTAQELADLALPDMPGTKRGVQLKADGDNWRIPENKFPANSRGTWRDPEAGEGPGIRYHYSLLPVRAQAKITRAARKHAALTTPKKERNRADAWSYFDSLPEARKAKARQKLELLLQVHALVVAGQNKDVAVQLVAKQNGIGISTLFGYQKLTHGIDRADWLPFLVDRRMGRTATAECDPTAWDMLLGDYLRLEAPTFTSCYERVCEAGEQHGWAIPSEKTLQRRLESTIPAPAIVLAREGREALDRMYPAQERDRTVFHALEAVNADGHKWDVFVDWNGKVIRPHIVAFQDLYSGMIVSWRLDDHPNKEAVRLAFGDLVETYGIPEHCWLDNGRDFAAKWITGGTPNRYRFKVKDEEPSGILTQLGVDVHWTTPYRGQAKPIERAFRDFCDRIAKDPRFAGAYTGNTPLAKPENYGSKAVPLEKFMAVVDEGIKRHNARVGRETKACQGKLSFEQAFRDSYAQSAIRQALPEQRRLWLLAAEGVRANSQTGSLELQGNRYWSEFLSDLRGHQLVVRFDPQDLHAGVHVYRLDGSYLGYADCLEAAGFADIDAARKHAQARKSWMRAQREMLEAHRTLTIENVADLMADPPSEPLPLEAKIVRPTFGSADPLMGRPEPVAPVARELDEAESAVLVELQTQFKRQPERVETDEQRFARAIKMERQIAAGIAVSAEDAAWLKSYQSSADYSARMLMFEDFGDAMLAAG